MVVVAVVVIVVAVAVGCDSCWGENGEELGGGEQENKREGEGQA